MNAPLILLGFGYVSQRLLALRSAAGQPHGAPVWATTRQIARAEQIRAAGAQPVVTDSTGRALRSLPGGGHVVVSFPPGEGHEDAWSRQLPRPSRLVYISSTGVYPSLAGGLDDTTQAAPDTERGQRRLQAEAVWRAAGAVILRAPAIYGPGRGVQERVRAGTHRLVDGGHRRVSRIHVDDLAACVEAALQRGEPGATHVVGDLKPSTQREVVEYICAREGLAMPPSVAAHEAPATLRGDRAVDPTLALNALGVTLRYPTYREGLEGA